MSTYDQVAQQYADSMGEEGDYYHRTQIDPMIYKMSGEVKGKSVYDLGCGSGYIARNLAKKGAKVSASDISSELIKIAQSKSTDLDIEYSVCEATDFTGFGDAQFDVVIMNMVLHYIKDLDKLFRGIGRVLKSGGKLVITTNHFFRPSYPYSDWVEGQLSGEKKLFIKVTGYLERNERRGKCWLDKNTELIMYNQTLGDIINMMAKHKLLTFEVEEPEGDGFAHDYSAELQKSHHIPTYIGIGAVKVA